MKKSTQVVVPGPLASFAAGDQRELFGRGYSPWTSVSYLYTFARLSRWLAERGLTAADLDAGHIERFVAERPGGRQADVRRTTPRGLTSLVGYLHAQGVVPDVTAPPDARDALLDEFAEFLRDERGLADKTIGVYRRFAGLLLSGLEAGVNERALTAQHVNAFILAQAGRRGPGSLNNVVTALRSLLRFLLPARLYPRAPGGRHSPHSGVA